MSLNKQHSKLEDAEIERRLSELPHWQRDGNNICQEFRFANFKEAISFVNQIAVLAERAAHHPDISIHWNRVILSLSTHSQGGLTKADFDLAIEIDQIISKA